MGFLEKRTNNVELYVDDTHNTVLFYLLCLKYSFRSLITCNVITVMNNTINVITAVILLM